MGLGVKLFNILGANKKMKEKNKDSFSLFRKGSTRYSFTSQKKKAEEQSQVQIQRVSWTSFPINKVTVAEDRSKPCEEISSRLSRSTENLKKQSKSFNRLCKSKSSSFFKSSSSSTIKNIFTIGGSSSTPASSSNSSVSSSPNVRQSWSSGVTNILEKAGKQEIDNKWVSQPHEYGENPQMITKPLTNYTKTGVSIPYLMEEENESEIMSTPKIICVHKKTPDVSRKQIIKELEYIKELGMLPEEIEPNSLNDNNPMTKVVNLRSSESFNLNSFRGYKNIPEARQTQNKQKDIDIDNRIKYFNERSNFASQETQDKSFSLNSQHESEFPKCFETDSHSSISSSCSLSSESSSSTIHDNQLPVLSETNIPHVASPSPHYDSGVDSVGKDTFDSLANSDPGARNPCYGSSLSSILVGSEYDEDSETMTDSDTEIKTYTFETRLEDNLEKLNERKNSRGTHRDSVISAFLSDEEDTDVQLRRKSRPNLYIDIEKARSQNISTSDRLRRIAENGSVSANACDSTRSSRSSPRTPRSPAIDIDVVFNERQKKIKESSKDNLSQVKDLTQRLRLSTQSNPSHIEWVNGLRNKSDARQLAEVMSPEVVENPEGVFLLQESEGIRKLTQQQREKNMTKALDWIKDELIKMREQDQTLARQLVQLQLEMQRLRLHKSCFQHEALLEEVTCEEEEQKALMTSSDLIEIPKNLRSCAFPSLRDFGVTRMNIASRRFTLR